MLFVRSKETFPNKLRLSQTRHDPIGFPFSVDMDPLRFDGYVVHHFQDLNACPVDCSTDLFHVLSSIYLPVSEVWRLNLHMGNIPDAEI